ncbi:MAG: hypothetical protein M1814_002316 [Vezdaea aestivalis]|nr:MAG: hypothetical protein M1814_002316 [Vezdaea aestivalis]
MKTFSFFLAALALTLQASADLFSPSYFPNAPYKSIAPRAPYGFARNPPSLLPPHSLRDLSSEPPLIIPESAPGSAAAEGGHGGRRTKPTRGSTRRLIRILHGTFMGTVFLLLLPAGGLLVRTAPIKHSVRAHAALQLFSTLLAFAGLGLGLWLGLNVRYLDYLHTILGFVVIAALVIQAILGAVGHRLFKRRQQKSILSTIHIWWGRGLLILAIVTGGLGLYLADNTKAGKVAYAVVSGVIGIAYIVAVVWSYAGQKQKRPQQLAQEK